MGYKIYEDCFRYTIRDKNDKYVFSTDTREKANKIINALEKQVPQEGYSNCPKCGESLIGKYCHKCGQRTLKP